jgi:heterotetrameric sarcosine oxidase gamma subunit
MLSAKKLTPIHLTAQELGAQFIEMAGWQVPRVFSTVDGEEAIARQGVVLADGSATGKILVEGGSAESVLRAVTALPSLAIGQGVIGGDFGHLYRLRNELFFFHTAPGSEEAVVQKLIESAQSLAAEVSVTDVTHGQADLILIGPYSPILLSRLCGLDFHPSQFPNLTAKQSSVAKTRQLILRRDLGEYPAFSLIGARSLANYLWKTLFEAGRDLNIAPIGQAAMARLPESDEPDD